MRVIKQIMLRHTIILTFTTSWEVVNGEWLAMCESVDGFEV